MLGKRFRRTTSMSQLGPGSNHVRPPPPPLPLPPPESFAQGMQEYSIGVCSLPPSGLVTQYEGYQDADCRRGSGHGHASTGHDFDSSHIMLIDTILTETPPCADLCLEAYEDQSMGASSFQVQTPSPLVAYQMGLWTHHHHMGFVPHLGLGKLQHMSAEASSMSPVDFLDACFHCKRRLTHERDIFIYRGDSAFCSEECRHRQILSDERRSRRGTNSKQGGARTSETAVAA